MNPELSQLHPYPFEKLATLKAAVSAPTDKKHIALSIGEPKHPAPEFVLKKLTQDINSVTLYPSTKGLPELREAIAAWATKRFQLSANTFTAERHLLPVNGTREAIFALTQALVDRSKITEKPYVVMPNPFYQIYEGATLLAGAQPYFLNCTAENHFIPVLDDVHESVWQQCQLVMICTPGNPSGSVMTTDYMKQLIALADQYDFVIASDECYSELYNNEDTPPAGLLQACAELGRNDYARCIVFHSLSKRSNLPGLRSGFVGGDASIMDAFLLYRTYHGCAMPVHHQLASVEAWQDEEHVIENRRYYREKFERVTAILNPVLPVSAPEASFYLWVHTPISDTDFAQQLFAQQNVTVLPGSYLARDTAEGNPGAQRVRMALVAPLEECVEAAERIRAFVESLAYFDIGTHHMSTPAPHSDTLSSGEDPIAPKANMRIKERADYILHELARLYPNPPIPLDHTDAYTMLVAVLLSAQCTDERVNQVTPALWQLANNPFDMAKQPVEAIQAIIRPCGLSPQKSKAIKRLSEILVEKYEGEVPADMEALEKLPGVGHKTASVVMSQAFGEPAFPVDTHIHRLAQRWGLTSGKNVTQTEKDLKRLFPKDSWNALHLQIIYYGREYCSARGCDGRICPICTTCYPNRKHPKKTKKA